MTTVNPRTKILKEIRRHIRNAISWYNVDGGNSHFYTTENYKGARLVKSPIKINYPCYIKSEKAIIKIAERILDRVEKYAKSNEY